MKSKSVQTNSIQKLSPLIVPKIWGEEKCFLTAGQGFSFPLVLKVITAREALSVQVHPTEKYARKYEGAAGKSEYWYVLDAAEGAKIVTGFEARAWRPEIRDALNWGNTGRIESLLCMESVKKGDSVYIPSGGVHSLGGGIKVLEVQNASDITYRLYDWGRGRELHIKKALDVWNRQALEVNRPAKRICICDVFFSQEIVVNEGRAKKLRGGKRDCVVFIIEGSGLMQYKNESFELKGEDAFLMPKGCAPVITGNLSLFRIIPVKKVRKRRARG